MDSGRVPFFRGIQFKYAVTYLLLIALVLLLLNTYPLLMAQNMVFRSKESSLKSQALAIATALGVSESLTAEGVEQAMSLLEELSATRILVTDGAGLILYDTSELGVPGWGLPLPLGSACGLPGDRPGGSIPLRI